MRADFSAAPLPALPASAKTTFHCTNRAGGQLTASPEPFLYGPDHALQFFSGLDVFPDSTYTLTFVALARSPSPIQVIRPHREKIFASNVSDSKLPSFSYPGPSVNTFPGFAVPTSIVPSRPATRLVTCAAAVLATLA